METKSYLRYEEERYLDIRDGLLTGEELNTFMEEEYEYLEQQLEELD